MKNKYKLINQEIQPDGNANADKKQKDRLHKEKKTLHKEKKRSNRGYLCIEVPITIPTKNYQCLKHSAN